ncbi:MAG: glycosyltransferase family 39 protein [Methanocellales archaeon]|nr:glycosyltransferase family 39 protein [Methanocellales archaeon]
MEKFFGLTTYKPSTIEMIANPIKEDRVVFTLTIGILSLIILRFAPALYYPVFSDACTYFYTAKQVAVDPSLLINPNIYYYPPLIFIIGAIMHTLLGEVGLKLIALVFGAMGIYFTYRLGKELVNEKVGLFGAIFLGIIPAHIYFSAMGYMEALVAGLLIAFVYYFYMSIKNDDPKYLIIAGVLAGLAGLSKHTGLIVFPFMGLFFVVDIFRRKKSGLWIVEIKPDSRRDWNNRLRPLLR